MAKANTRPKTRGRRPPARRNSPAKPTPAAKTKNGKTTKPSSTKGVLAPYRRDIQGLLVLLLAVLAALAVWWHAASPGLQTIDIFLRGLLGYGAFGAPVLLAGLAVAILRDRAPTGDAAGRVAIGSVLAALGGISLIHLARGGPDVGDVELVGSGADVAAGTQLLQNSGGVVGAAVSGPVARLLSPWGAGAVFTCLLLLGILIITKTPVAAVGRTVARAGRWAADLFQGPATPAGQPTPRQPATTTPTDRPEPNKRRGKTATTGQDGIDSAAADPPAAAAASAVTELKNTIGTAVRRRGRAAPAPDQQPLPEVEETAAPADPAAGPPDPEDGPPATPAPVPPPMPRRPPPPPPEPGDPYSTPPQELLRRSTRKIVDERRLEEMWLILENTFDQFEVDARVVGNNRGPTVTMYEVEVGTGTKVNKVVGLGQDIAYALASPDVRIIAPIPGKSAIGIEVPNRDRDLVTLGDILHPDGNPQLDTRPPLTVALGKDINNQPVLADLATMPHVLIAGSTGSGKSVSLNVLVTSLLMRNTPDQVRLILIDPKRVEMSNYEGAPHLITPVVTHPKRAAEALDWAVREMEMRLETLALAGMRNIAAYNQAVTAGELRGDPTGDLDEHGDQILTPRQPLPYIVVVIDELADLMMIAPRDVEDAICRIAQMARAVGIHLVVATQRPSVDVVTGLIKANIPSRVAFMVASAQDSRVILDTGGAEKLIGHGDMLYLPGGTSKPLRVQGAFITEKEVAEVVGFCKAQQTAAYQSGVVAEGRRAASDDDGEEDPMLAQAMEIIVRSGLGSTSMLQSKMKVGFSRARRIMDQLEERGVVGPSEGSKPRDVLMTVEQLEQLRGREASYGEPEGN